jgi:hypothetical protein
MTIGEREIIVRHRTWFQLISEPTWRTEEFLFLSIQGNIKLILDFRYYCWIPDGRHWSWK